MSHKLVRDKIPDIIRASGREFEGQRVEGEDYINFLADKLSEEHDELKEAFLKQMYETTDKTLDELQGEIADVLEVINAIVETTGIDTDILFDLAAKKREERGAFQEGYILKMDDE